MMDAGSRFVLSLQRACHSTSGQPIQACLMHARKIPISISTSKSCCCFVRKMKDGYSDGHPQIINGLQGHIWDSKEYYAPIITPHEAQLAFTPGAEWGKEYRLDFESLLDEDHQLGTTIEGETFETRVSLVDSQQHNKGEPREGESSSTALSVLQMKDLSQINNSQKHLMEVQLPQPCYILNAWLRAEPASHFCCRIFKE